MGLFSKKPKSIIVQKPVVKAAPPSDSDAPAPVRPDLAPLKVDTNPPAVHEAPTIATQARIDTPAPAVNEAPTIGTHARIDTPTPAVHEAPKLATPAKLPPPKPPKPAKQKNRKGGVDPADFLALRSELIHMKARLDESEQQRAIVEARLGALDATASAFSSERSDISEIAGMVLQLQQDIKDRTGTTGEVPIISGPGHDELSAKVDALQNRLFGLQDHGPKIAEFETQLAVAPRRPGYRSTERRRHCRCLPLIPTPSTNSPPCNNASTRSTNSSSALVRSINCTSAWTGSATSSNAWPTSTVSLLSCNN